MVARTGAECLVVEEGGICGEIWHYVASMRAVGAAVAAPLRVDTLPSSSPAQVVCRTNFPNASGCLATQPVAQQQRGAALTGCTSVHRFVKSLDIGRQNNHRFHPSTFACRCSASGGSEDASNLPRESKGWRNEHNDGGDNGLDGEVQDEAGPSSVWDLPSRHKRMQVCFPFDSNACVHSLLIDGSQWSRDR